MTERSGSAAMPLRVGFGLKAVPGPAQGLNGLAIEDDLDLPTRVAPAGHSARIGAESASRSGGAASPRGRAKSFPVCPTCARIEVMVLPVRIELTTSPLPRGNPAPSRIISRRAERRMTANFPLIYRHISPHCAVAPHRRRIAPGAVDVLSDRCAPKSGNAHHAERQAY